MLGHDNVLRSLDRCFCPSKGNGGVLRGFGGGGRRVTWGGILDYDADIDELKDVSASVKLFPAYINISHVKALILKRCSYEDRHEKNKKGRKSCIGRNLRLILIKKI
jgi:hypothetical protein